jgi:hypothetical protein
MTDYFPEPIYIITIESTNASAAKTSLVPKMNSIYIFKHPQVAM